jgi:hypothetical protein
LNYVKYRLVFGIGDLKLYDSSNVIAISHEREGIFEGDGFRPQPGSPRRVSYSCSFKVSDVVVCPRLFTVQNTVG